ncbi:MAG TPA: amino acid transport protein [bacterium]|nr:amino acid transport protein [bacterium]
MLHLPSAATLVLGGILSLIGIGAFMYGRRIGHTAFLIGGGVLMVVPYFVGSPPLLILIGAGTVVGMYLFRY